MVVPCELAVVEERSGFAPVPIEFENFIGIAGAGAAPNIRAACTPAAAVPRQRRHSGHRLEYAVERAARCPTFLPGELAVDCRWDSVGCGPGGGATDTGDESGRNRGSAVVPISGSSNTNGAASACSPNEVSVIQPPANLGPRRFPADGRQTCVLPRELRLSKEAAERGKERWGAKKKATFSTRPGETFPTPFRCAQNYLGGSVDLGAALGAVLVAGFGVVPVAAGLAAGLGLVPEEVGAGTPDCAL
jgi:hypothetical protein